MWIRGDSMIDPLKYVNLQPNRWQISIGWLLIDDPVKICQISTKAGVNFNHSPCNKTWHTEYSEASLRPNNSWQIQAGSWTVILATPNSWNWKCNLPHVEEGCCCARPPLNQTAYVGGSCSALFPAQTIRRALQVETLLSLCAHQLLLSTCTYLNQSCIML